MTTGIVVIHGGAGSAIAGSSREAPVRDALQGIVDELWEAVADGDSAIDIADRGSRALEDCPQFNAGRGSKIQRDGSIRMSASVMDGNNRSFSGVINVEQVQNPTAMATFLQGERDRVLDGQGSQRLARRMNLELFDPIVERRFERWVDKTRRRRLGDGATPSHKPEADASSNGTVGVVVYDRQGELAAVTSTGGRGFERVGRVSDTATVAGNYATDTAAVSCTGTGEDIIDEALAARIVVRMECGHSLDDALQGAVDDAGGRHRSLAAIGVDADGHMSWAKTTEALLAVGRSAQETRWAF